MLKPGQRQGAHPQGLGRPGLAQLAHQVAQQSRQPNFPRLHGLRLRSRPSSPSPDTGHGSAGQSVRFHTWRCPIPTPRARGQLSDFQLGAVQRGWNLPWNQSVHCHRPVGADFLRFQVQPDRIGHLSTNSQSLYTGTPPLRPVQIPCLIWGDAGDTGIRTTAPPAALTSGAHHRLPNCQADHPAGLRSWLPDPRRGNRPSRQRLPGPRRSRSLSLTPPNTWTSTGA